MGIASFLVQTFFHEVLKCNTLLHAPALNMNTRDSANATAEVCIQSLLCEAGIPNSQPPILCNNLSAIYLASNPIFHAKTRHIEIDYYFLREKAVAKQIQVRFISSSDQIADIFTKGLSSQRFCRFHFQACGSTIDPSPAGECVFMCDLQPNR